MSAVVMGPLLGTEEYQLGLWEREERERERGRKEERKRTHGHLNALACIFATQSIAKLTNSEESCLEKF